MSTSSDVELSELLKEFGKRKNASRLEPYRDQILFLHHHGFSTRNIALILKKKYALNIHHSTLHRFIQKNTVNLSRKLNARIPDANSAEKAVSSTPPVDKPEPAEDVDSDKNQIHPMFQAAFDSRSKSGFDHDPLKRARMLREKQKN